MHTLSNYDYISYSETKRVFQAALFVASSFFIPDMLRS